MTSALPTIQERDKERRTKHTFHNSVDFWSHSFRSRMTCSCSINGSQIESMKLTFGGTVGCKTDLVRRALRGRDRHLRRLPDI